MLKEMPFAKHFTLLWFIGRSLVPSPMSFYLCVLFSTFWIALHLLLLSVSQGTSLPGLLDGQWATAYTNAVVRPIQVVISSPSFANVTTTVLWGLFGLLLYSVIEMVVVLVREERQAEQDQMLGQRILHHPMRRAYIMTILWRASVLLATFAGLALVNPLPRSLLEDDAKLIAGGYTLASGLEQLGFAFVCWMLLAHGFVVFLRLLLLKPRLFGGEHLVAN